LVPTVLNFTHGLNLLNIGKGSPRIALFQELFLEKSNEEFTHLLVGFKNPSKTEIA
jgi:hypothetical protein